MNSPKQALRLLATAGLALVLLATPAQADILLEFDELIFGAEGSVRTVGQVDVPDDLVGRNCQISAIAENQASVHPGNDVIVSTGDSQAVIVGVEDEVNGGTVETYQVVVGPSIVVQLRFGEDEMSSLGFGLSFDCDQPVPTTADPSLDGQQVDGSTSSTVPTAGLAANCDDGTIGAGTSGGPSSSSTTTGSDDPAPASGADSGCAPTSCTAESGADGHSTDDASATGAPVEAGAGDTDDPCPAPTAAQAPSPAPSTTTSAPPTTVAPTSVVSTTVAAPAPTAAATPALPPSPVASAIVAAPAYAG